MASDAEAAITGVEFPADTDEVAWTGVPLTSSPPDTFLIVTYTS